MYTFVLYIVDRTPRSERARRSVEAMLQDVLGDRHVLEITDVLSSPQAAEDDHILVTPTLIRRGPGPEMRVVGDLSDAERLRAALGLENGAPKDVAAMLADGLERNIRTYPICGYVVDAYYRYTQQKVAPAHRADLLFFLAEAAKRRDPYMLTLLAMVESPGVDERRGAARALSNLASGWYSLGKALKPLRDKETDARVKSLLSTGISRAERAAKMSGRRGR